MDVVLVIRKSQDEYTLRRTGDQMPKWYVTGVKYGDTEVLNRVRLAREELVPHLDSIAKHLFEE